MTRAGVEAFAWREEHGVPWLEAPLPGARAVFSTRLGGASAPPYDSLNLGILTDDDPALVRANRRTLAGALGRDADKIAFGLQVHGADVQVHERPPSGGEPVPSDAQATADADLTRSSWSPTASRSRSPRRAPWRWRTADGAESPRA